MNLFKVVQYKEIIRFNLTITLDLIKFDFVSPVSKEHSKFRTWETTYLNLDRCLFCINLSRGDTLDEVVGEILSISFPLRATVSPTNNLLFI